MPEYIVLSTVPMDSLEELIRCKDCRYLDYGECNGFGDGHYVRDDDFCSNAERREE